MNRMIHTQSEPQTSFGIDQKMAHMQHQQQSEQLARLISSAYHAQDAGFDGSLLLPGQQKFQFDFLPNFNGHPGNHLMQNGGLLGNHSQQQSSRGGTTNGMTKKKKGNGPGRRPALDSNGLPKERPFACPRAECGKRFCRNDHLQRHMRIHTGQRMFQCRTCLRSFSRSDHLAKHERTHSADKPYSCHTCARRFHKHEEQKKHEEKCQHKLDDAPQNMMNPQMMYQNPSSSSSSAGSTAPPFGSAHHFHRLVDDIERFNAIAELELDDEPI